MTITIKDVASQAGVSASTVSRVLANSPKISEETKRKVRQALTELDYHPNVMARALVTNTAGSIGVVITPGLNEFFANPFFSEMMIGLSEVARQNGFDTVLSTSARSEEEVLDRMIHGRRVDGVLLLGSRAEDPALKQAVEDKFPAVLLGRPADDVPISYVNNDNVAAAYVATKHLLDLGHKSIGFLGGEADLVVTIDRLKGYRQALEDAGVPVDTRLIVYNEFFEQNGYVSMMRLLALSNRPTAVLASDDVLAFGGMRAAAELGYRMPEELAIVGFNDIRMAELANPSLTSVHVNMYELGVEAGKLLVAQIRHHVTEPTSVIVPTKLVVRNSCGASSQQKL